MSSFFSHTKPQRKMSTYNLQIDQHSKNQFIIDLIFVGNQIYNGLINLAKTTAGIIILIPLSIALILVLPITYILLSLILIYYLLSLNILTSKALKIVISKENYTESYNFYLFSNKCISDFVKIESKSKEGGKGMLLSPVLFFIKKFHTKLLIINRHLEGQLFEKHYSDQIPSEHVEFFRSQLKGDEEWGDDEQWKEFQNKHHHLAN